MTDATSDTAESARARPSASWRADGSGDRRTRRRLRRVAATVAVVALIGFFVYLFLDPLRRPKTALVLARPAAADFPDAPPFAERDTAATAAAAAGLLISPPEVRTSGRAATETFDFRSAAPDCDVLVVGVRAYVAAEAGRAVLLWDTPPGGAAAERYLVRDLLAAIAAHPAPMKLLVLDAADPGPDRRAGRLRDDFADLLAEDCANARAGTWVLASHSPGERPHVSPALLRSVFGYCVDRGIRGAADADGNGFIGLRELHAFVRDGVSPWVRETTGGRESQTPLLIACGRESPGVEDPTILPAARFRFTDESAALTETLAEADAARQPPATPAAAGSTAPPKPDAASPAPADPAAAGPPAAATPTGVAASKPLSAEELLEAGWQVRDDLERGGAVRPDPRIGSPHLWRALVRRLETLGAAVDGSDPTVRVTVTNELHHLVPPLKVWASGGDPDVEPAEPVRSLVADRPAAPAWQPLSFGMAEAQAAPSRPMPEDVASLVADFDRLTAEDAPADFVKWLSERNAKDDRFAELRLARKLMALPSLDWRTVKLALSTRRAAERLAAAPESAEWLAPRIEEADSLRRAAERWLIDGVGANRRSLAKTGLEAAAARYAAASRNLTELRAAAKLRIELFALAPDLIAWHEASGLLPGPRTPAFSDVASFLDATRELSAALDAPADGDLARVRAASARAASLKRDLEAGMTATYLRDVLIAPPDTPDDFLRLAALLATPLPAAGDRPALTSSALRAERTLLTRSSIFDSPSRAPARPLVPDEPARTLRRLELERRLAALIAEGDTPDSFRALLEAQDAVTRAADDTETRSAAIGRFESASSTFWRRSVPEIASGIVPSSPGSQRSDLIARLRIADRALRLLDPSDALAVAPGATERLRAETQSALLAWQSRRLGLEAQDAPAEEAVLLSDRAAAYRDASALLTVLPPETSVPASIALRGPDRRSLESSDAAPAAFTVVNSSGEPADIWLTLDHDPDLISISDASEKLVPAFRLRQQLSGTTELPDPASFDRPDRSAGEPPAFRLSAGAERNVSLRLSRRSGASGPTRLILRAVPRPVRDGAPAAVVVRHDIIVDLPRLAPARLAVVGPPGTVGLNQDRPVLTPFPNRVTPYQLSLSSLTGAEAAVDVALYPSRSVEGAQDPALASPIGIDPLAADAIVARLTDSTPLFTAAELKLPGDGTPVPLPFPKPAAPPTGPGPAIDDGLLLVVTDRSTGRRSLHVVMVRPQHPRRYLEPRVSFDAESRRIEIAVRPRDPALLPPGGSTVSCEVVEGLPVEAARRLEGLVGTEGPPLLLFTDVGERPRGALTLRLTVDGYPRAFLYRVPLAGTRTDVPEETGQAALRIVAPTPGTAFKSPFAAVPVVLEADAPLGTRWDAGDGIDVGLDRDRDRELIGETSIRLRSDRQVTASVEGLSPGGAIAIETKVGDFRIDLPSDHLARGRVNVIARLVAGARETWSAPVEIVVDDAAPAVVRVRLAPRRVLVGAPLDVVAEASDDELSGVSRLLVGVDVARTGEFAPEAAPVAAAKDGARWIAKVDTAKLLPGPYYVLVRPIDAVGNPGPYARERFEIVTEAQLAADAAAAVNRVSGFVNYRGRPMAGFDVSLEPLPPGPPVAPPAAPPAPPPPAPIPPVKTNDQGAFTIPAVPPGKYRVIAEGLYTNRRRVGEAEVAVPPAPLEVPPVELVVDPR